MLSDLVAMPATSLTTRMVKAQSMLFPFGKIIFRSPIMPAWTLGVEEGVSNPPIEPSPLGAGPGGNGIPIPLAPGGIP